MVNYALFIVGLISIGIGLYYRGEKTRGKAETEFGRFEGTIDFILIILGILILVAASVS